LVGLAQSLRLTFPDCQILRPNRTVANTGKDPRDLGGSTMAITGKIRTIWELQK
jgi:hypothetical protein